MWTRRLQILVLLSALFSSTSIFLGALTPEKQEAQALAIRRIVGFWQDGELDLTKQLISEFFEQNPSSSFEAQLNRILGDIAFDQGNWQDALVFYNKITSKDLSDDCLLRQAYALSKLEKWKELTKISSASLPKHTAEYSDLTKQQLLLLYVKGLLKLSPSEVEIEKAEQQLCELIVYADQPLAIELLAELYGSQGQPLKGSTIYEDLVKKYPEKRALFSYQAALLQAEEQPKEALEKLRNIQSWKEGFSEKAAYRELLLCMKNKAYADLIKAEERLSQNLSEEHKSYFFYVLGCSFFEKKQFSQAEHAFSTFIKTEKGTATQRERALFLLIQCAEQRGEGGQSQSWLSLLERDFPNSSYLQQALCLAAKAYENQGQYRLAILSLERLLTQFFHAPQREWASFKKATFLYELKDYSKSRSAFTAFILEFPNSQYTQAVQRYLPPLILAELKAAGKEEKTELTKQAISILEKAIYQSEALKGEEKAYYQIQLAQLLISQENFQAAIQILETFFSEHANSSLAYQAHYLMAVGQQQQKNYTVFTYHAEKVLILNPNFSEKQNLEKSLVKTYIFLASQETDEAQNYAEKAADRLYTSLENTSVDLERSSLNWLANYTYQLLQKKSHTYLIEPLEDPEDQELAERTITVYEKILDKEVTRENALSYEKKRLQLAHLQGWSEDYKGATNTLGTLYEKQKAATNFSWKEVTRTHFALAYAWEQRREWSKARDLYELLLSETSLKNDLLRAATQLHLARVCYQSLRKSQRNLDNPEIIHLLSLLESLQTQRLLDQEPIHLEAGIDAAEIRAACSTDEVNQPESLLKLLVELKNNFSSKNDIYSRDYHRSRELQPQQDLIYQAYLMLIDARIAYLQLMIDGKSDGLDRREEAARTILSTLCSGKFAVSRYLVHQAEKGLKALNGDAPLALPEFCEQNPGYL